VPQWCSGEHQCQVPVGIDVAHNVRYLMDEPGRKVTGTVIIEDAVNAT
jgi:hypothetical protein